VQALAVEAKLLAAPVSFETASTPITRASRTASRSRRLRAQAPAMVELGERLAAIELIVQRRRSTWAAAAGVATARYTARCRELIPATALGERRRRIWSRWCSWSKAV
jgi:hypothetical protein